MKNKRKTTAKASSKSAKSKSKAKKPKALKASSKKAAPKKAAKKSGKSSAKSKMKTASKKSTVQKSAAKKTASKASKKTKSSNSMTPMMKRASKAVKGTLESASKTVTDEVSRIATGSRKKENPAKGPSLKDPRSSESISNQSADIAVDATVPGGNPIPEVITEGVAPHQGAPYPTDEYVNKHALNEKAAIAKGIRKPRGTSTHTFASPGHARDSSGNK